ncbi:MAG TPA: ATP-binding protein [Gemmatimonadaceae bacterium]|nr:ATP-binding protein [Gemmatimonadaceae bacterium]
MTATVPETPTVASEDVRDERVNILLVDDRPENLLALEAILEPLGENLVRAHSGDEALKCLLTDEYAAILLDVQMPGLNGFQTAELIKSRERTRYVPIIFLTAISKDEEYVFRGYSVGAVDYMAKPFQPDVLRSKVAVFVDLYRKQQQLKRQERLLREAAIREVELEHRARLLAQEARLAQIVSTAMDAILVLDAQRRIRLFNAAAERMFGRSRQSVMGKDVGELFPDGTLERVLAEMTPAYRAESNNSEPHAVTGARANGERFPVEATVSCLDVNGQCSYTLIARDVTERKRDEEALREQAISLERNADELRELNEQLHARQEELEHAMSARNRFYASMSHELRTPINAIIGYNTLLLDHIYGPLNDKQTHGLQRTHKAANHLLELVNDVLDLSKIEAGKIELSLQPVPFPGIIEDLFVTVRPLADEHSTPLELHVDGDTSSIISDPRRVRQILLNLLSNAIKFGRGKPITVQLDLTRSDTIEVAVTDRGEGIEPDDVPRIFDEFVQLSNSQQFGGTGLGLPISKRLASLLGGSLEVRSERGAGSTFRLTLPMRIGMPD